MLESSEALGRDLRTLLGALRSLAGGSYACVLEPHKVLFEDGDDEPATLLLRRYVVDHAAALFGLPEAMAGAGPRDDVFAGWRGSEGFLVAFVNRRVAVLLTSTESDGLEARVHEPLRLLAERLLRFDPRWRADGGWLSLFLSRPRLDVVVVGSPDARPG